MKESVTEFPYLSGGVPPNVGLVLEGGGMRGVFTCGALDYLMDVKIRFPYVVAVSAGACNGLSYMSGQRGRAKLSNIDMLERYQYIGLKYLWTQHSVMDLETLYKKLPNEYLPFDYAAYFRNPACFEMVTTNCRTGRAAYLSEHADAHRLLTLAQASSSLPFVCPIIDVDGEPMLDGGIVDSIPLERSISTGHVFNVIISTRNLGYRDKEVDYKLPRFLYRNYPRLRLMLSRRHITYNTQLAFMEQEEEAGRAIVVRPQRPIEVGRLERDVHKLTVLYEEGYEEARRTLAALL